MSLYESLIVTLAPLLMATTRPDLRKQITYYIDLPLILEPDPLRGTLCYAMPAVYDKNRNNICHWPRSTDSQLDSGIFFYPFPTSPEESLQQSIAACQELNPETAMNDIGNQNTCFTLCEKATSCVVPVGYPD